MTELKETLEKDTEITDDELLNEIIQKEITEPRKKFTRKINFTPERREQLRLAQLNSVRNRKLRKEAKQKIIDERLAELQQKQAEELEAEIRKQAKNLILKQRQTLDTLKKVQENLDTEKIIHNKIIQEQEQPQQQPQPQKLKYNFL